MLAPGFERMRGSALASEIEFLTARSRAIGSSLANTLLAEHGLRVRSYSVLALACDRVRPSQKDLAAFLQLDPSQIVSIVDGLELGGLVRREPDLTDRRSKVIVATESGESLRRLAALSVRAAEDQALAALSTKERSQLRALLQKAAFPVETGDTTSEL